MNFLNIRCNNTEFNADTKNIAKTKPIQTKWQIDIKNKIKTM